MRKFISRKFILIAVACAAFATPFACSAQGAENFYAGRTISLIVGTDSGGGQDAYSRLLARHLPRHIPGNPTITVQYMPGGSGRRAANQLFSIAPQDGTVISTLEQNIPFTQAMQRENSNFDSQKFGYLGSISTTVGLLIVAASTGVTHIDQAKQRELVIGATGTTGSNKTVPVLVNELAGTKFRVVSGYKAGADVDLALERGEIEGRGNYSWSSMKINKPQWIEKKLINILVQAGLRKAPDLPDVPLMVDLARTDMHRAVAYLFSSGEDLGRMFMTTPNLPPARLALLREAFDATMNDSEFRADARRLLLDVSPSKGERIQEIIGKIVSTPRPVLEEAKRLLE